MFSIPDPNIFRSKIVEKYGLDHPMDGKYIRALVFDILHIEIDKSKLNQKQTEEFIYKVFRNIFQNQFEIRGLIIDFESIDNLSKSFVLKPWSDTNTFALTLDDQWIQMVDSVLHNWTCSKCKERVFGVPHDPFDCNVTQMSHVMNS